jgi:Domain of unknown function (DUF4833)
VRLSFLLFYSVCSLLFSKGPIVPETPINTGLKKAWDGVTYPVPPVSALSLFYLQRSTNTNTVIYDLNLDKTGKANADAPVRSYWIRYAEQGQRQELSFIQRKFAFGLTSKAIGADKYDIRIVSYKKIPLTLMRSPDGKYHIFAQLDQKQAVINRIFVKIEGGTFWFPNVVYLEMTGTELITGREIIKRFKP